MRSRGAAGRLALASSATLLATTLVASPAVAVDGAEVFNKHCAACHMADGVGTPGLAPPLVSKHVVAAAAKNPHYAALVVLNGLSGAVPLDDGSQLAGIMPPVGMQLSDEEVAGVVNYVFSSFAGTSTALDAATIAGLRPVRHPAKELRTMREGLLP